MASLRRRLSPIHILTEDVLAHIFDLAASDSQAKFVLNFWERPYALELDDQFAFTVATVCREWRSVALSTPRLWASISLNFEYIRDCQKTDDDEASEKKRKNRERFGRRKCVLQ